MKRRDFLQGLGAITAAAPVEHFFAGVEATAPRTADVIHTKTGIYERSMGPGRKRFCDEFAPIRLDDRT